MEPSENIPNLRAIRSTLVQVVANEPQLHGIGNNSMIASVDSTDDDDHIMRPAPEFGGHQTFAAESHGNLGALPHEILRHVMSFLDYKDAPKLSLINSWFRATFFFSMLHAPKPLIQQRTWFGVNEKRSAPLRSVRIPILLPPRTHSVVLTCRWNDSFYGRQTGALFVVSVPIDDTTNTDALSSIENGQIVYQSPPASHQKTTLVMSFNYSPAKAYFLWYRLGAGYSLSIEDLTVHTVIYDHADRSLLKIYDTLKEQTESSFYLNLLYAAAHFLSVQLENGQEPDSPMVRDTRVTATSMMAMKELTTALIKLQSQEQAHSMFSGQGAMLDRVSFAIVLAYLNASR
jgi:hypothetical protein